MPSGRDFAHREPDAHCHIERFARSTGGVAASNRQCEALLATALDACERYYPAFQFVVWSGKSAREALDSAMFETAGEA